MPGVRYASPMNIQPVVTPAGHLTVQPRADDDLPRAGATLATVGYRGAWLSGAGVVLFYLLWACVQAARQESSDSSRNVHGEG